MTGAMYAAISGLKAHMNKLNVIGNNIANVNTYGYKTGRTVFETSLYTSMRGGSNGTPTVGAKNPSQVGYGVQIGSIDLDMSSGTYAPTGRPLDCMIAGDGFFMVGDKDLTFDPKDPSSLKAVTLSRVGNFEFRADGYLTDGAGNAVYGFLNMGPDANGDPTVSNQLVPIRFPKFIKAGTYYNADGDPVTYTEDTILYPSNKNPDPDAANPDQKVKLYDEVLYDAETDGKPVEFPYAQFDSISIDEITGKISGTCKDTDEQVVIGFIGMANVTNPNGVTQMTGSYYKCGEGAGDLTVSLMGGAAELLGIDFVNGELFEIPADADPDNPPLPPEGMRIGSAGTTQLYTGGLEMSKTDLATEISEMITTQRGYQANTRIITVTDAMLEELVNIKR